MNILALVMRFIGPILGLQQELQAANAGDHVETQPVGHARIFGRRVRPYVVFIVEE